MMAHFVLVHGLSQGAWCWYKVRCLLETAGYKVTCLDLKSAGIDRSDPDEVSSFEDYNHPLINFFSNLPENEKVILVGHSAGGVSVTYATYKFTEKIQVAVYVAAPMLKQGFSTEQDIKDGTPDLSEYGDVNEYGYGFGPDQPPTTVMVKSEFQREILYHMSPLEDSTLASMLTRPGPRTAGAAKFIGDEADKVPRVYIKTLHDRVLKREQQEHMITRWPPSQVFSVESDHSPFFSAPFVFTGLLAKIASSIEM
ncbi:hypothetical protein F0562_021614 [Nyssa sinensis]|uniref:AB hydrolase-1 domain-containing protein n=1 Tax=Nyssa sinensis TaxID=561372 RepID=A0A5J5BNB9_9ASTE|nr:hypothetical protein F0562_021614 [Nyssa sinensis]